MSGSNPHEEKLLASVIAGGPLAVEDLAELLWYRHPDSGDSPADSWEEEAEYVKEHFRDVARVVVEPVLSAVRTQREAEDAEDLRWLARIGAIVEACPSASGEPGPTWHLHPRGFREHLVIAPELRSAVKLLDDRIRAAGLMVVVDTRTGEVASPWAMPKKAAKEMAMSYGRKLGEEDRFAVYPAHRGEPSS